MIRAKQYPSADIPAYNPYYMLSFRLCTVPRAGGPSFVWKVRKRAIRDQKSNDTHKQSSWERIRRLFVSFLILFYSHCFLFVIVYTGGKNVCLVSAAEGRSQQVVKDVISGATFLLARPAIGD